jgi:hypothetical protein
LIPALLALALLSQTGGTGGLRRVSVTAPITGNGTPGSPVTCRDASGAVSGCVSTGAQTFAGVKTFANQIVGITGTGATPSFVMGTGAAIYSGGGVAGDLTMYVAGSSRYSFTTTDVRPGANNLYPLGTTALRWLGAFFGDSGLTLNFTDSSGTPGAATINKTSGISAMAAAAGSVVITNSTASTSSRIHVQPLRSDATCTATPWIITKAAGSFTVSTQGGAVCTVATSFDWQLFN